MKDMEVRIMALVILILEIRGLYISIRRRKWRIFQYYTQLSNIVTAFSVSF